MFHRVCRGQPESRFPLFLSRFVMRRLTACLGTGLMGLVCNLAAIAADLPDTAELGTMSARFAPVDVRVDLSSLPTEERAALAKLVEASRYVDALFMRQ